MKLIKCDRCKGLHESSGLIDKACWEVKITRLTTYSTPETGELCPKCYELLREWMADGKPQEDSGSPVPRKAGVNPE